MKKIFFLAALIVSQCLFHKNIKAQLAENVPAVKKCDSTISKIPDDLAEARISCFKVYKKDVFKNRKVDCLPITIEISDFKELLLNIRSKYDDPTIPEKDKYDGVRIYFAVSEKKTDNPGQQGSFNGKLTLVLVPTINTFLKDENDNDISDDDDKNIYVLKDGKFDGPKKFDASIAKTLKRYERFASIIKTKLLKQYQINLDETQSLWFSKEVLFVKGNDGDDILSYIKKCVDIDKIEINFGSWTFEADHQDLIYKTDLLFRFLYKPGAIGQYFSLGGVEIIKNHKAADKKFDLTTLEVNYTDTGLPCPPNKCP